MTRENITRRLVAALSGQAAVGLAIMVALASLSLSLYVNVQRVVLTECLARYNNADNQATVARWRIATEDRALDEQDRAAEVKADEALDKVLDLIAVKPGTQEARQAFQELREVRKEAAATRRTTGATRARNEDERKRNPIPPPPSETC